MRKSHSWPVIMYYDRGDDVDGVMVGKVTTGKNSSGRVRHVGHSDVAGRVGTFDTFREAESAVKAAHRKHSKV